MIPYQKGSGLPNECGMPSSRGITPSTRQCSQAAADEQEDQQQRDAAKDVDVGDRQPANRRQRPPGKLPQDRQHQPPGKRQGAAEMTESLNRVPEAVEDGAELVSHDAEVEVVARGRSPWRPTGSRWCCSQVADEAEQGQVESHLHSSSWLVGAARLNEGRPLAPFVYGHGRRLVAPIGRLVACPRARLAAAPS